MVFTKRMKHARMSSTCCWMGDKSGATVGRKTALAKYISTRTVAKDTWPLVLTCPGDNLVITITENKYIIKSDSIFNPEGEIDIEVLSRTSNSIKIIQPVFGLILDLKFDSNKNIISAKDNNGDTIGYFSIFCNITE